MPVRQHQNGGTIAINHVPPRPVQHRTRHPRACARRPQRAAGRAPAPAHARRRGRPDASAGPRQAAAARVRVRQAALDDPVGAAGRGQDHAGAAHGAGVRRRVHRHLGGALRRQGHPRSGRARAHARRPVGRATILFVDEVHRFNKAQQDAFLPHVESGPVHLHRRHHREPLVRGRSARCCRARRSTC